MTSQNTQQAGANNDAKANDGSATPGAGDQAAAAAATGGSNSAQPNGAAPVPPGGAADSDNLYRPAGLPDHMVGANDRETIDKLAKAVDGFRKKQASAGVPDTVEGYTLDLADDVKGKVFKFDENGRDPVWDAVTPIFLEHGFSKDGAIALVSKLAEVLPELAGAAGGDEGIDDGDFSYSTYGGPEKARPTIDGVTAWANGLKSQGILDDADVAEIGVMTSYGRGLAVLAKLRAATGAEPIPGDLGRDEGGSNEILERELQSKMRDPRYWKTKDPAFVAEVTEGFRKLYGEK